MTSQTECAINFSTGFGTPPVPLIQPLMVVGLPREPVTETCCGTPEVEMRVPSSYVNVVCATWVPVPPQLELVPDPVQTVIVAGRSTMPFPRLAYEIGRAHV